MGNTFLFLIPRADRFELIISLTFGKNFQSSISLIELKMLGREDL